ncbi:SMP-30/gluconolactonase/LRE family protein [Bacteroidota bacterium]
MNQTTSIKNHSGLGWRKSLCIPFLVLVLLSAAGPDEIGGSDKTLENSPTEDVQLKTAFKKAAISSLVAEGAKVEKLAGGFEFTEGPAVDRQGNIYFTDIPNSRIHKWSTDGQVSTFMEDTRRSNGLMFDRDVNLLACEGGGRRLVSIDPKGEVTVLAEEYNGKKFNSPNDLWIDPNGGIYFTDPRYGNRDNMEQDGEHVYYLSPDRKQLTRVIDDMIRPNGVLGTPDGKTLYVADHGDSKTFAYKINPDGLLSDKQLFASMGSDGLALDELGNLYLTEKAVKIYSPEGDYLEEILIDERPTNVCFGGKDGKTLFVSAQTSLYAVKMKVGPAKVKPGKWTTLDCNGEPDGRHETTFMEFEGRFYLIGGRESNMIDRFDPKTNTWSKMKAESPIIHHFQPVLWNNKIYMVGAMTGNYPDEPPMSNIQIYDPKKDQWTEGGEIPKERQRGGAGTVVYKDKIYMACGITLGHTSGTNNWFDEYDPATDTWKILPDAPHKRDHFHAVVIDDKMYCLGGRSSDYHEPGNFAAFFGAVERAIDCFDFKTGSWSTLETELPVGSAAAGTAVLDGKILYFGGETVKVGPALNRTWLLDLQTGKWTEMAGLNQGRHGTQAIVYKNKVYIASGSPIRGGGNTQTIEVFTLDPE